MAQNNTDSKGLAIASLVLGIIAILGSFIPIFNFLSGIVGLIALILSIVALVKKQGGMAIAGLVLAILSFVIGFIMNAVFIGGATMLGLGTASELKKHINEPGLDVIEYKLEATASPAVVSGILVNNTGKEIMTPVVGFDALDAKGDIIKAGACSSVYPNQLAAGEQWHFSIECDSDVTPSSVELSTVTFIDTPDNLDITQSDIEALIESAQASPDSEAAL